MAVLADKVAFQGAATIVPLLGVVVSIFIGFRNSNAYNRWWEARTLWGTVVGNCRAISNALIAVDDCSDEMAVVVDRMRRRQVRHAWQLAAELRGVPAQPGVVKLTPEDPPDASAGLLLSLQANDVRDLVRADRIDRQGRVILTNLNTAQALAAGGLERIRNQPIPLPYAVFVRALAWFFGIMVCTRLDNNGHDSILGILVGVLIMALFVVAERLGHFIEEPMSNTPFDLPMNRFCAGITADLLGPDHPLARPPDGADAVVWM
jgi:putative membrane protein